MAEEIQFPFVGINGSNSIFDNLGHCQDNRMWRIMLGMTDEKYSQVGYSIDECKNAFFMPAKELPEHRIFEGLPDRADFE